MRPLVLVAEPDPFALGWLEETCASAGCEVVTALDGEEAIASLARETPSLIIAASALPIVSGEQLLEIVRRDPELRAIAVLLGGEAVHRGDVEPDARLARPYRVTEVQAWLRRVLDTRFERRRRARESETSRRLGDATQWRLALEQEAERALRHRAPLGCLRASSRRPFEDGVALTRLLRVVDEVFVLGDGELGVLLPDTPGLALAVVAARVRAALPALRFGLASLPDDAHDASALESQARARIGTSVGSGSAVR